MKTLYRQFIQTSLVFLVLSIVLGIVLTNVYYLSFTKQETIEQNLDRANEVAFTLEQMHGDTAALEPFLSSVANLGYQIALLDSNQQLTTFGEPFEDLTLTVQAKQVLTGQQIYTGENSGLSFFMTSHFSSRLDNTVGVPFEVDGQQYALFLRQDMNLLSSDIHTLLLAFLLSIAVVNLAGMFLMARQLTRPISLLHQATREVANDNYSHQLAISRPDEIGDLANSFNEMIGRLRQNDESRKTFITNVSHDLQSPLMNIKGYAELLSAKAADGSDEREYAEVIEREAKRLSGLAKQLLLLSSLDQPAYHLKADTYSLDDQIREAIKHYRWRLEEKELDVSLKLMKVSVYADRELMNYVWDNLISNAIKYSPSGSSIRIHLADEEGISVVIEDNGIGISAADLPYITERFYRADQSRSEEGTGLGLAIVKEIVRLHEGKIEFESKNGEGTKVKVYLPQYEEE
ncbi:sensor histidine kinase [Jeotgalibacillus haloalkalitolerans]|uniref:Heme sensor protein HssS n=1 Tax=Jeotgalibacillus haloalkalitolerans TaxID=3104292 RepID=A0ABU5KN29_9BACL|nr:HAMP domain-containing sensor histidine kinase [Jeotgalibacillus sp. HH7-29]MDZ5712668.1 HAMP domain-containing sensor histidine kinase [Jeotgalibacillus sp. HH7-29]